MAEPVTNETIAQLAVLAGLEIPEEDIQPLLDGFRHHLDLVGALDQFAADSSFDGDNMDAAHPVLTFDPRWRD